MSDEIATSLSDWVARALPTLEAMPKAKQYAIREALEAHIDAKKQELQAQKLLLRALHGDYTWWHVDLGDQPKKHWSAQLITVKVPGCGNLDAVMRARRTSGLRYIHAVREVLDPEGVS